MNEERNDSIKLVNLNENNVGVVAEERIMNGSIKSLNILPQTHHNFSEKLSASTSNLQTTEEKQRQRTRSNVTLNGVINIEDASQNQMNSANIKMNSNNRVRQMKL